jgi:signal transduction histidine kinase/CheY-like chemotaxis protein
MQRNSIREMIVIMIALIVMFRIYNLIHKRQREIEVEKIKAEESSRAKSAFLSNMSHDIRTPLNAIIGYTEIAKKVGNIPEKELEYLDKIEASGHHLLALINDVLDMSRIESGKIELDIQCADITEAINNVYDLFNTQMDMKGITYNVNVDDVTDKYVMCDANRINRVLINLVSNAYKFTASGGNIDVKLTQLKTVDNVATYELKVKDTGVGMSKEFADKVFEAFEREDTAGDVQGTGLGMAITKSIIDMMGGTIKVDSKKGVGTEFVIKVDLEIASDRDILNQDIDIYSEDISFEGLRALLVEDQSINREIATMILNQYGISLEYAENGKEAVEKVVLQGPGYFQVIFMDIQMPVMNGYDAAKAIRSLSDKELATIPIIAMTANAFSVDVKEAIEAGMDGHIAKPIEVDKMLKTLNEVLNNKEADSW